ncbi:MAG: hypothetical protein QOH50_2744 [Kribbellaceae bacterium]|nr:hypothetical protein [Kribbellaceae bacterium]
MDAETQACRFQTPAFATSWNDGAFYPRRLRLPGTDVAAEVRHLARAGDSGRDIPHCRDAARSSIRAHGMSVTDWTVGPECSL